MEVEAEAVAGQLKEAEANEKLTTVASLHPTPLCNPAFCVE